ncbi:MAG: hypothetical protein ACP5QO_11265 [Clostridia bacterium]
MADITYSATDDGWLYLATLERLAVRQIVGRALEPSVSQALTLAALDRAVARHRPPAGLLHHSDRRSQYAVYAYPAPAGPVRHDEPHEPQGELLGQRGHRVLASVLKQERVYLSPFRTRRRSSSSSRSSTTDSRSIVPGAIAPRPTRRRRQARGTNPGPSFL